MVDVPTRPASERETSAKPRGPARGGRLAELAVRAPKRILLVLLLITLGAGAYGSGTFQRLQGGGFDNPDSESARAALVLQETFGTATPNLVLLVSAPGGVDAPAAAAAGEALVGRLAQEADVTAVTSYWTTGRLPTLRAGDGDRALVLARITGTANAVETRMKDLLPRYEGERDGLRVQVGGSAMAEHEIGQLTQQDAARGESLVFPVTLVVLVLVFGSVVAAGLPLAVAFVTMLLALAIMGVLGEVTDVSIFVLNVVTFLGLGLAIDYSLLLISRYREELRNGLSTDDAIRAMMRTAGRTVVFSAVTVAVALAGLALFPLFALSSLAYAGITTSLLAALVSLTAMPALLRLLGPRIERWRIFRPKEASGGFWHRLAMLMMRRPVPVVLVTAAVLLLLGAPALGMKLRVADENVLPQSTSAWQVASAVRADFDNRDQAAIHVIARDGDQGQIDGYAKRLAQLPGVVRVEAATGTYANGQLVAPPGPQSARFVAGDATYLSVLPTGEATAPASADLARTVRDTAAPFAILVGGAPAVALDTMDGMTDSLPYAAAVLAVAMFILLYLLTGSVVMPLIAMLLSGLSLTATFGALVFIFQDGNLAGLLDVPTNGTLVASVPVMLFALAFGLAMDYQVFLLSRIREEYHRTGDPVAGVANGLERTGRIVTAAALLIAIVFAAFTLSGVTFMKAFGIGLPLAVLMDATLVRGALLPALLRLFGKAAWWAPGPLRRLHARYGLHDA
ncbi:MMPL family transporter [Actinomycetes bacterium KLBMP 9797]